MGEPGMGEGGGRPAAPVRPAVFLVEGEDPFVVSCAACGGVTQVWGYDPVELLPWKVVEHWLAVHWDRTGLDEESAS